MSIDRDAVLRKEYASVPQHEVNKFLLVAEATGLDPLSREIYLIARGGRYTIQTAIDGYRKIAAADPAYGGIPGCEWCDDDGVWGDVWPSSLGLPTASRAHVARISQGGVTTITTHVALWSEYNAGGPMWKKMPSTMLSKCAEAGALRKAFPGRFHGVYVQEEMDQADSRSSPPLPPAAAQAVAEIQEVFPEAKEVYDLPVDAPGVLEMLEYDMSTFQELKENDVTRACELLLLTIKSGEVVFKEACFLLDASPEAVMQSVKKYTGGP